MRVFRVCCKLIIPAYSHSVTSERDTFTQEITWMREERNSSKYDNACSKDLALLHFLPFFSADKSAPSVKLETPGTSVKTVYCCPCPDSPVSCSPLVCAETPRLAQWFALSFLSWCRSLPSAVPLWPSFSLHTRQNQLVPVFHEVLGKRGTVF